MTHPVSPFHADDAEYDIGNAENLSHVEYHLALKSDLYVFGPFYEEAEGEYQGEHEAEIPAASNRFGLEERGLLSVGRLLFS